MWQTSQTLDCLFCGPLVTVFVKQSAQKIRPQWRQWCFLLAILNCCRQLEQSSISSSCCQRTWKQKCVLKRKRKSIYVGITQITENSSNQTGQYNLTNPAKKYYGLVGMSKIGPYFYRFMLNWTQAHKNLFDPRIFFWHKSVFCWLCNTVLRKWGLTDY